MAANDPAWDRFAVSLKRRLEVRQDDGSGLEPISREDLSTAVGRFYLDPNQTPSSETVRNWTRTRTRDGGGASRASSPPLSALPAIAEVMYGDPKAKDKTGRPIIRLLQEMEILPKTADLESLVDRAYRLEKLQAKIVEAQDAAAASALSHGASTIVQAALRTGEWAVAVWPAIEGPAGYQMRVGDRIDFRPLDEAINADTVWQVPELKAALRSTFAVRGDRHPRWAGKSGESASQVSMWAIPHIGRPASPTLLHHHHGFTSVAFVSLTAHSWVNDIASLTAMALGYGFTMTRDLAVEISGHTHDETTDDLRRGIHARHLAQPPKRRVWSHHAPVEDESQNPFRPAAEETMLVRIREADQLLEVATASRKKRGEVGDLFAARDRVDAMVAQMPPDQVIAVEVNCYDDIGERWAESLRAVSSVLDAMSTLNALNDLRDVHARLRTVSPKVGAPLLDWLRDNGCKAVR